MSPPDEPSVPPILADPLTPESVATILRQGPLEAQRRLPVALSMDPPEHIDVESICLGLARHEDPIVRGNAVLGLGHLARTLGQLDPARVKPVLEAALQDDHPWVRGHAEAAASDIRVFLGGTFS